MQIPALLHFAQFYEKRFSEIKRLIYLIHYHRPPQIRRDEGVAYM